MITLTPRVDPLIAGRTLHLRLVVTMLTGIELIAGSKTGDAGVKNAMMKALQEVVSKAGANMGEASKNAILGLIDDDASNKTGKVIVTSYG